MKKYWGSLNSDSKYTASDLLEQSISENHQYRPDFKFYGDATDVHFGIELEYNVAIGTLRQASASALLQGVNENHQHFYCKRDGSLLNGFEFNSMPMTYAYYRQNFADLQSTINDAKVYATDDCGFHVHISKGAFANATHRKRFITSLYNLLPFLLYISNRKVSTQVMRYATLANKGNLNGFSDLIDGWMKSLKATGTTNKSFSQLPKVNCEDLINLNHQESSRYAWLSTSNRHTIELRLFKGTTDWSYVLNVLGMLKHIFDKSKATVITSVEHLASTLNVEDDVFAFVTESQQRLIKDLRLIDALSKKGKVISKTMDWDMGRSARESVSNDVDFVLYRVPARSLRVGDIAVNKKTRKSFLEDAQRDGAKDALKQHGFEVVNILDKDGKRVILTMHSASLVMIDDEIVDNYVFVRRHLKLLMPKLDLSKDALEREFATWFTNYKSKKITTKTGRIWDYIDDTMRGFVTLSGLYEDFYGTICDDYDDEEDRDNVSDFLNSEVRDFFTNEPISFVTDMIYRLAGVLVDTHNYPLLTMPRLSELITALRVDAGLNGSSSIRIPVRDDVTLILHNNARRPEPTVIENEWNRVTEVSLSVIALAPYEIWVIAKQLLSCDSFSINNRNYVISSPTQIHNLVRVEANTGFLMTVPTWSMTNGVMQAAGDTVTLHVSYLMLTTVHRNGDRLITIPNTDGSGRFVNIAVEDYREYLFMCFLDLVVTSMMYLGMEEPRAEQLADDILTGYRNDTQESKFMYIQTRRRDQARTPRPDEPVEDTEYPNMAEVRDTVHRMHERYSYTAEPVYTTNTYVSTNADATLRPAPNRTVLRMNTDGSITRVNLGEENT